MSTVNANVSAGYIFVADGDGKVQITKDRLNLLGVPTVTVELSGVIQTADIVDGVVTAAKLVDAVADRLVTAVATVPAEDTNNIDVSVQAKDAQGNALSAVVPIFAFISATATGTLAALPSGGAPTIVSSQGTIIIGMSATLLGVYYTNASGLLVLRFTEAGALTRYFRAIVGGKTIEGSAAMTWAA